MQQRRSAICYVGSALDEMNGLACGSMTLARKAASRAVVSCRLPQASNIQVRRRQRIPLDELAARLDLVTHQRREDFVRTERVLDLHLHEAA